MKHRKELLTHFWLYWFSTLRVEWLAQMGLEVTCLSCWFGVQAELVEQEWFMTRDISSVEIFLLSWVEENSSNLQALSYNMSLLHIHFMKVRAGCPWSFAPDLAHDNGLPFLHRRSQAVPRWRLSLCRRLSLAQFLRPDLCPHPRPGAGEGGLWGTESWGEKTERFSSSGLVYTVAKNS